MAKSTNTEILLANNYEEYLAMVKSNPVVGSYAEDMARVEDFIVSIVDKGKNIEPRDPLGFGKVMTVPEYRAKELICMLGDKIVNKLKR